MKREIFKMMWQYIKAFGLSMSDALKEAWKVWKLENEKVFNQGCMSKYVNHELKDLPKIYIRHALNQYWACKDYWSKEDLWADCKMLSAKYPTQFKEVIEEIGKPLKRELMAYEG